MSRHSKHQIVGTDHFDPVARMHFGLKQTFLNVNIVGGQVGGLTRQLSQIAYIMELHRLRTYEKS